MTSAVNESASNLSAMSQTEVNSERSRLVSPSTSNKPTFINIINNVCAVMFTGIIIFCCFKDGVTLFSFHPTLMSLGWIILMSTAVNAITPGDLATEWMPIRLRSARHWVLQVITVTLVTTGFFVILSNKIINSKNHFVSLHAKLGLASFIFMIMTSFGGLSALYSLQLKDYIAPIYTKLIHSSFGLITFLLGVISIILGMFSAWWSFGEALRDICIILVVIILILTMLRPSLKVYFRLKEKLGYSN